MATAAALPTMICDAANGTGTKEDQAMNSAFQLSITSKKPSLASASKVQALHSPPPTKRA
jgi:hypothetical protein